LVGASRFPRHWIYDATGSLVEKTADVDRNAAERDSAAERTPRGDESSPALVMEAESAVERALAAEVSAADWTPRPFTLATGQERVHQGEAPEELAPLVYLVLDGAMSVDVDGETVAEVGAGAIVGERALLEGGRRTATLRAATPCKILPVPAHDVSQGALSELSEPHRREGRDMATSSGSR
jgi:CRP-like cAMP-binding protein